MAENFAKERSTNFSKHETEKLLELLQKYSCITSKKTDSASVQQKEVAWKALVNEFNQGALFFRNVKQLQYKFNNMKKKARQEMSQERKEKRKTGGGPPPDKPSTSTEWLNTIMGDSISGRSSIYDSDSIVEFPTQIGGLEKNIVPFVEKEVDNEQLNNAAKPNTSDTFCNNFILINETEDDLDPKMKLIIKDDPPINYSTTAVVFDSTTPKTLLRKPISKELVTKKKKAENNTPLVTRKKKISLIDKKEGLVQKKSCREKLLRVFMEEEHRQNLTHKKELHELEMDFKKRLHEINIEKAKVELEIEKERLKNLKNFNHSDQ